MTRFRYLVVFIFTFLLFLATPDAATCDYKEKAKLNNEAANVKGNYEIKERVLDKSEYTVPDTIIGTPEEDSYVAKTEYFQVNILNLTENLYVQVTNDVNKETKTFNYNDSKDGIVSFTWENKATLITYTIKVYSSNNTGCEGTLLKTIYVALPRFNVYSEYAMCKEEPEYYLCQKYVTFEDLNYGEFTTRMHNEVVKKQEEAIKQEEANKKWYEKASGFIKKNKVWFITGGVILVGTAGAVTYVIIRKRRRDVL